MKILMLTYEVAEKGGNYLRSFSLAKNLAGHGHKVTLVASNTVPRLRTKKRKISKVTVIEPPGILSFRIRHNGLSPFQIIGRVLYVAQNRYDIVHGFGHRPSVFIPSLIHKVLYKSPYIADWADLWGYGGIASLRGGGVGRLFALLDDIFEKIVYRTADGVTVISNDLKKRVEKLGKPLNKLAVIPIGADIDTIKPLSKKKSRIKLGLPSTSNIVVFVGNAPYDEKLLAQSFVELIKLNPKTILLFAGAKMAVFEEIINKHKLQKKVIHKGFIPHNKLSTILASGDVMLLPYTNRVINRGRYPNKLGDYLAAGRPTVSNPTGEVKRLFEKEKIGLLAQENARGFARAINSLLKNKNLSASLGKNARIVAETKLSWSRQAKNLLTFYQSQLAD